MKKVRVDIYTLMFYNDVRTVMEVAKATNISSKALYDIVNGKTKRIDFDTIEKLCRFFSCNIGDLLVLEEQKKAG